MAIIQKKEVREITEQERKCNRAVFAKLENAKHSRVIEIPMNRDLMNHYQVILEAGFKWLTEGEVRLDFDNSKLVIKVPVGKLFLKDSELLPVLTKQLFRAFSISKNELTYRGNRGVILKMIDDLHQEKLADDKTSKECRDENENILINQSLSKY